MRGRGNADRGPKPKQIRYEQRYVKLTFFAPIILAMSVSNFAHPAITKREELNVKAS